MKTVALIMFGSAARGTSNEDSDIDLLSIVPEGEPFSRKLGTIELQVFSIDHLFDIAERGDLFAGHLATEGKALFDPSCIFPRFRETFTLRQSYERERQEAFFLLAFLNEHHGSIGAKPLAAKRAAWCARTIMISLLAESGRLVFSPEGLVREFSFPAASSLVALRRNSAGMLQRQDIVNFCNTLGEKAPPQTRSIREYLEESRKNNFSVAVKTISSLKNKKEMKSSTY